MEDWPAALPEPSRVKVRVKEDHLEIRQERASSSSTVITPIRKLTALEQLISTIKRGDQAVAAKPAATLPNKKKRSKGFHKSATKYESLVPTQLRADAASSTVFWFGPLESPQTPDRSISPDTVSKVTRGHPHSSEITDLIDLEEDKLAHD